MFHKTHYLQICLTSQLLITILPSEQWARDFFLQWGRENCTFNYQGHHNRLQDGTLRRHSGYHICNITNERGPLIPRSLVMLQIWYPEWRLFFLISFFIWPVGFLSVSLSTFISDFESEFLTSCGGGRFVWSPKSGLVGPGGSLHLQK